MSLSFKSQKPACRGNAGDSRRARNLSLAAARLPRNVWEDMTLRQHSLLRGTKTLAIVGPNLRYSFHSAARDYQFDVPLSDIRPKFDEYRQVAWSWYLVGIAALGFLGIHFRAGVYFHSLNAMFVIVYMSLGLYALSIGWRRSGRFLILRSGGDEPRTIWILRDTPSRREVDAFIDKLKQSIPKATEPNQAPSSLAKI